MKISAYRHTAVRHSVLVAFVIFWAATSAARVPAAQQTADRVVESEGLRLARYPDGSYQLSAEGVLLEDLVGHLEQVSVAEFSVAPELHHLPVTIETDRVTLEKLLEQLRVVASANLILATTREHTVSRVWLTATTPPEASSIATAATVAEPGVVPVPTIEQPSDMRPVPLGNELRVAGYDPTVDVAAYIREQAAAATTTPTSSGGVAGQEQVAAGQLEAGTAADPAESSNQPPVPMDTNALENYFAGDGTTETYHRLNCIQVMYLPSVNKVWFKSRQEAIAAGYTPHDICIGH